MVFQKCPECGKKGLYLQKEFVRGYKGISGDTYKCKYCRYSKKDTRLSKKLEKRVHRMKLNRKK